jgi:hypothetical protein
MRIPALVLTTALLATLAACSPKAPEGGGEAAKSGGGGSVMSGALTEAQMPRPKLGTWKMSMTIPGVPQPQQVELCLTQAMIDDMRSMKVPGAECGEAAFSRDGAAYVTRISCTVRGQKSTTTIRTEGDFNSRYTSEMTNVGEPPQPGDGQTTRTVAEYVGPC